MATKSTGKEAPAKKSAATKAKTASAKTAKPKSTATAAAVKKAPAKTAAVKTAPAKKTVAKKTVAKKTVAKKAPVKKTPAKKTPAKKTPAKKTPAKRASAAKSTSRASAAATKISGYGAGSVNVVMSVDQVAKEAANIAAKGPSKADLDKLAKDDVFFQIQDLRAGYGKMEILHNFSMRVGQGQSLCLIGPNGAGKSTVLHSIFGFTNIFSGKITINGRDVTSLKPSEKLATAGIAYILQDKSVFPQMTVEENLLMGGFLKGRPAEAKAAAELVFDKYSRLAERRNKPAGVLSGGERRLLEISRALVMNPEVLLVDEPSIGLEPRFIDMVFEILYDLQKNDGKTIIMVEQNAKKGLDFADIGYVLVSGETALADEGNKLLKNPDVGRLFLGG